MKICPCGKHHQDIMTMYRDWDYCRKCTNKIIDEIETSLGIKDTKKQEPWSVS